MKKLLPVVFVLMVCLGIGAVQAKVGDVNGVALHTDIVAYINNYAIPSYAVNGQSCIVAEDLANFGFDVRWDGNTMTLYITRGNTTIVNEQYFNKLNESGSFFSDTLETEVTVYAGDKLLTSYAINGFTMIPVEELTMFGNVQWVPEEAALKMWIDGLNTRQSKQLIVRRFSPTMPAQTTIEVATAKQLLDAIGSNKRIVLTSKKYNLSDVAYTDNPFIEYSKYFSGFSICGIENMTIIGNAEIVVDDIYATVLDFESCSNITLEGLTIGHTAYLDEYACEGNVTNFFECSNIKIKDCNLFGCGAIGVSMSYSVNFNINNTNIYDCSLCGISIGASHDVSIDSSDFYYSSYSKSFCSANDDTTVKFSNCYIYNTIGDNFIDIYSFEGKSTILFEDCSIYNNSFNEIVKYDYYKGLPFEENVIKGAEDNFEVVFKDCYFDNNSGNMKRKNVFYINDGITKDIPFQFSDSETMYSLNGTTIVVDPSEIEAYKKAGWYDIEGYTLVEAEKYASQNGYSKAISTMLKYTDSWATEYIYDNRIRAAVENAIDILTKKWYKTEGTPLVVVDWYRSENSIGTPEINITFMNISDKVITAFETYFTCYDAYGDVTTDYSNLYNGSFTGYADAVQIKPGSSNTYTWTLHNNKRTISVSWPTILRIAFADGTVWKK